MFKHHCEVMEVALNQRGQPEDRQLAYMDKNYDLYLLPVRNAHTGWNIVHIGECARSDIGECLGVCAKSNIGECLGVTLVNVLRVTLVSVRSDIGEC